MSQVVGNEKMTRIVYGIQLYISDFSLLSHSRNDVWL